MLSRLLFASVLLSSLNVFADAENVVRVFNDNLSNKTTFSLDVDASRGGASRYCDKVIFLEKGSENSNQIHAYVKRIKITGNNTFKIEPSNNEVSISKNDGSKTERDFSIAGGPLYKSINTEVKGNIATHTDYSRGWTGLFKGSVKNKTVFDASKNTIDFVRDSGNCKYRVDPSYQQLVSEDVNRDSSTRENTKDISGREIDPARDHSASSTLE